MNYIRVYLYRIPTTIGNNSYSRDVRTRTVGYRIYRGVKNNYKNSNTNNNNVKVRAGRLKCRIL